MGGEGSGPGGDQPPRVGPGLAGYDDFVEIGQGGFGVVYRATETDHERTVAVKLLSGRLDDATRRRFDRERRAMGKLSGHPHIVTVHASGFLADGRPYIVMEYLSEGSLADRLDDGPLPWPEAFAIGVKVADALAVAHRGGVLHRDVKPENVLVSQYGEPKLGDFGIAAVTGATATRSGTITASMAYAAPEVLNGDRATEAADVYSLGATIYALIAGQPAFVRDTDENVLAVLTRLLTEPVPDLRSTGVPNEACGVLERAMAKDLAERTATVADLGRQLAEVQTDAEATPRSGATATTTVAGPAPPPASAPPAPPKPPRPPKQRRAPKQPRPPKAPRPPKPPRPARGSRRRRVLLGAAALAVLVIGGGLVWAALGSEDDTDDGGGSTETNFSPRLAVGEGALWAAEYDSGTVFRLDPATNAIAATIAVEGGDYVAAGDGAVWVTGYNSDVGDFVVRIDPATNTVTETIELGASGDEVVVGEGAVWVLGFEELFRIDPATNTVTATIPVDGVDYLAVGEGAVWVAHTTTETVYRIDPVTDTVTVTIPIKSAGAVAVGEGAVWVVGDDRDDNSVVFRIDPATNEVTTAIEMSTFDVAVGEGSVWLPGLDDDFNDVVVRIDPVTNSVAASVPVTERNDLVVGAGAVWVTQSDTDTVFRIDPATNTVTARIDVLPPRGGT